MYFGHNSSPINFKTAVFQLIATFPWCRYQCGYMANLQWLALSSAHLLFSSPLWSVCVMQATMGKQWSSSSLLPQSRTGNKRLRWEKESFVSVISRIPAFFFNFFSFIFISWRLITLQYCSGFCHTLTWISHGFTWGARFFLLSYMDTKCNSNFP